MLGVDVESNNFDYELNEFNNAMNMSAPSESPIMGESDPILCPECGWTGTADQRVHEDGQLQCPICAETFEYVE